MVLLSFLFEFFLRSFEKITKRDLKKKSLKFRTSISSCTGGGLGVRDLRSDVMLRLCGWLRIHARHIGYNGVDSLNCARSTLRSKSFMTYVSEKQKNCRSRWLQGFHLYIHYYFIRPRFCSRWKPINFLRWYWPISSEASPPAFLFFLDFLLCGYDLFVGVVTIALSMKTIWCEKGTY